MRTIVTALMGLSLLAGVSSSTSAGDCKVTGWSERQPGQHPIFVCPDLSGAELARPTNRQWVVRRQRVPR
jgi:hypothetical protein